MFDENTLHREMTRVTRHQRRDGCGRGGGHQAIGLRKRDPPGRVLASPPAGLPALRLPDGQDLQAAEQALRGRDLRGEHAANDLLDVYAGRARHIAGALQRLDPAGHRSATEIVDQNSGVEKHEHAAAALARIAGIGVPLAVDPGAGIIVPLVAVVRDGAPRRSDEVPPTLPLDRIRHRVPYELASPARTSEPVDCLDQRILEFYVQTHGRKIAPSISPVTSAPESPS